MQSVFLKIMSTGMNTSWMILAIFCLRMVFRKSPKWLVCFMWFLVGIRLLCPYNIESTMSLVPIQIEVPFDDSEKNILKDEKDITYIRVERNSYVNRNKGSEKHSSILCFVTGIWVCGMLAMLLYFVLSCFYLSKRTETATYLRENIWESEFVFYPYIGFIRWFGWLIFVWGGILNMPAMKKLF